MAAEVVWNYFEFMRMPKTASCDPALSIDRSLLDNAKEHHREAVQLAMTDLYGHRREAMYV